MRIEIRFKSITLYMVILLSVTSYARAGTWTFYNVPGANFTTADFTTIDDIEGHNLVGEYRDTLGSYHGFLYNGVTWTTIDKPGAQSTSIHGIDGGNLVGNFSDGSGNHGFLYDGTTWTTLDMTGATSTFLKRIDGSNIVGYYMSGNSDHGCLYNGSTWTNLDMPGATNNTTIWDIDGGNMVGTYWSTSKTNHDHGFLYDGTTWTPLDKPGATDTWISGISGSNIVGNYSADGGYTYYGFLYNGITWTTIDYPGMRPWVRGIEGNNLFGYCQSSNISGFNMPGFVYTIPEPATLLLFGLGAVFLRKRV